MLGIAVPAEGKQGYINFCNIDFDPNLDNFIKNAKIIINKGKKYNETYPIEEHRPDAVFLSHVNGYYTALNNPNDGKFDFTPRINWGTPEKESGIISILGTKIKMPITIETHHSIISGYHIDKFLQIFQETCDKELKAKSLKDKILGSFGVKNNP